MATKEEKRERISRMMGVDKSQNPEIDFDAPNNIKMVAPTFDRVNSNNLSTEPESSSIISAESVQNLSIVSAKLINVDNFLKDSLVLDKVNIIAFVIGNKCIE